MFRNCQTKTLLFSKNFTCLQMYFCKHCLQKYICKQSDFVDYLTLEKCKIYFIYKILFYLLLVVGCYFVKTSPLTS